MKRKMTKLLIVTISAFIAHACHAQTWEEWFQQKKTQQKYLIQQIAALQVYLGDVEKGYDIAKKGLGIIQQFKSGEFDVHRAFFNSLDNVNPNIKNDVEITKIIALQISIVKQFKKAIKCYRQSDEFNTDELSYINKVYTNLTSECLKDIEELLNVTTDNHLQMTDDERMKQIQNIYADMQDKNSFSQYFIDNVEMLANQRARELNDLSVSQSLYGLPNQ